MFNIGSEFLKYIAKFEAKEFIHIMEVSVYIFFCTLLFINQNFRKYFFVGIGIYEHIIFIK